MKISKFNAPICVKAEKVNTITAPPKSIYKLLCAEEIPNATLFAVNIVVVKEAAAKIPQNNPFAQSIVGSLKSILKILIAKAVPINTMITEIIFGSILFIMGKYKNIIFVYAKFSRNIFHSIRFSRALVC